MGVLWPPLTKKFQHTLAGAEKSVKYRVWPGRNKTYFHHTIRRETQNSPAKVFTKSARLPAKRRPLRFFTPRCNRIFRNRTNRNHSDLSWPWWQDFSEPFRLILTLAAGYFGTTRIFRNRL